MHPIPYLVGTAPKVVLAWGMGTTRYAVPQALNSLKTRGAVNDETCKRSGAQQFSSRLENALRENMASVLHAPDTIYAEELEAEGVITYSNQQLNAVP